MSDLGEALLDAHVAYESARLRGDALAALIDERVAAAFEWLEEVSLNDVMTPERIIGVIQRYAIDLRSMTGGRGIFTMSFDHYDEVPAHLADKIIAEQKRAKEEAHK